MTRSVAIYGFGSAFGCTRDYNDVDLLIIHLGIDPASCHLAIACKRRLVECTTRAHVTILSDIEDAQLQFINRASAVFLGTIREHQLDRDVLASALIIEELIRNKNP